MKDNSIIDKCLELKDKDKILEYLRLRLSKLDIEDKFNIGTQTTCYWIASLIIIITDINEKNIIFALHDFKNESEPKYYEIINKYK